MKIDLTETEACKFTVHYEANFIEIGNKKEEVLTHFKKAPVPGFRAGKASLEAVKLHYGKQIDEAVKRALAEDAYHNTLFEKKLRVHGAPKFNSLLLDGGKFVCEFEVHTKPEFVLLDWKNLEIPKPHEKHTTTEVAEKMMQELRERLGDAVPYSDTDFVQLGDSVILDYEGTVDGQKVDSLCASGEMISVGKNPLTDFDNNLLGMSMGTTREFDYVAPEGGLPSLSGKTINFTVTVTTGAKTIPCALDDEMAKKMGKNDFHELQEFVGQAAFARVSSFNRTQIQEAVSRRLVADTQVVVPTWMSLSEAQYLAQQSQLDWTNMSDTDKEKFVGMAEKNVTLSLVLDQIRETTPETQLTDQEVFEIVKKNLANTQVTASIDEVIQQMNRTGYLQILFSRIRDEHTMDYIMKNVKLID
jgi:trigger factor